jgi:hypothetical protein
MLVHRGARMSGHHLRKPAATRTTRAVAAGATGAAATVICLSCSIPGLDLGDARDAAIESESDAATDRDPADGGDGSPSVDGSLGDSARDPDADAGTEASLGDASDDGPLDYRDIVLQDHPLAYWRLDESIDSGTHVAYDSTSNHLVGIYTDGVTLGATGALVNDPDTAVQLSGGSVTVSTFAFPSADAGASLQTFSIEAWINPEYQAYDSMGIAGYDFAAGFQGGYFVGLSPSLSCSSGNCDNLIFSQPDGATMETDAAVTIGAWNYVVVTYDGTTLLFYVDGVSAQALTQSVAFANQGSLVIGRWANVEFSGTLDEVAIYDHALSPQRIGRHFQIANGAQ